MTKEQKALVVKLRDQGMTFAGYDFCSYCRKTGYIGEFYQIVLQKKRQCVKYIKYVK